MDHFDRTMTGVQAYMESVHRHGCAELDPVTGEGEAQWYVVITDRQITTAAAMAGRGFGVYLPMLRRLVMADGRLDQHSSPLFPGYVFVLVGSIGANRPRLRAIAGVRDILSDGNGMAVVVPPALIAEVQAKETSRDEWLNARIARYGQSADRKWRRGKRGKRRHDQVLGTDDIMRVSCYSALAGIETLAPEKRISSFHRALGLAMSDPATETAPRSGPGLATSEPASTDSAPQCGH